jgi:Cytosol aminopeptidase family, catalytic domain
LNRPIAQLNGLHSVYAMNGKSVEIDNTDAEGRLILSGEGSIHRCLLLISKRWIDALYYTSTTYKPHTLIDVATLTGFVSSSSCIPSLISSFTQCHGHRSGGNIFWDFLCIIAPHRCYGPKFANLVLSRRPLTLSGRSYTQLGKPNMIGSGECPSMKITVPRSTPPMLICAT